VRRPRSAVAGAEKCKQDEQAERASHLAIIQNVATDAAIIIPEISVIVPARNEEASLGACLQSILAQGGVRFEIIVVDDGSTDRTPEIARSFPGVRTIRPAPLPSGWSGKNNALCAGASAATGEWLLFTDADTVHLPGSLARSLAEAKQRHVDFLSYSPKQEVHGFWEKAIMAVIFAELAATYHPQAVSDPNSPVAAANGQYILVTRSAYVAVGGHASVATSLLEDVALARAMKQSGRGVFFRYGGDAVRTRMYRSFSQLREGWSKNLALLFRSPLRLAWLRFIEFAWVIASAAFSTAAAFSGRAGWALWFAALAIVFEAFLLKRIRKAHFSWDATGFSLLGLPLFSYLLVRSWFFYKRGHVRWKGREYNPRETPAEPSTVSCIPVEQP
jgi:glycosyltransferase involved in cell wall biosynthesis